MADNVADKIVEMDINNKSQAWKHFILKILFIAEDKYLFVRPWLFEVYPHFPFNWANVVQVLVG